MSSPLLIMAPGWSYHSGMWDQVKSCLKGYETCMLDFFIHARQRPLTQQASMPETTPITVSMFSEAEAVFWDHLSSRRPIYFVGHSFGAFWALGQMQNYVTARSDFSIFLRVKFGIINGFSCFVQKDDDRAGIGIPLGNIHGMLKKLSYDQERVVKVFRHQIGDDMPLLYPLDGKALEWGLRLLCMQNYRPFLQENNVSFSVLAGKKDPLVIERMTRAQFPDHTIHWVQEGGHLLPFTHPCACADFIQSL